MQVSNPENDLLKRHWTGISYFIKFIEKQLGDLEMVGVTPNSTVKEYDNHISVIALQMKYLAYAIVKLSSNWRTNGLPF